MKKYSDNLTLATVHDIRSVRDAVTDVAELVWNHYGVSGKLGRSSERAYQVMNHAECIAAELALSEEDHRTLVSEPRTTRTNRFSFRYVRGSQRLLGELPRELHMQAGRTMKDIHQAMCRLRVSCSNQLGKSHSLCQTLRRADELLGKVRAALDERACRVFPEPQATSYYYGPEPEPEPQPQLQLVRD